MTGLVRPRAYEQGATLVELVITIVIISVAIAGVVGAFGLITGRSADPLNQTRAVALAQLYVDEILSRRYNEDTPNGGVPRATGCTIGTDAGETGRPDYDDVDDYNAINSAAPENAEGTPLSADYSNFRISISVECAGSDLGLPNDDAKRVDLTVTDPSSQTYAFSVYRANF